MLTVFRFNITKLNLKLRHNTLKTGTADGIPHFSFVRIPKILYLWALHHGKTQMNNFKMKFAKWGVIGKSSLKDEAEGGPRSL